MASLDKIQKKLNEDKAFQEEFINDPTGTLEKEGIILSDDMKEELEKSIKDLQTPKQAPSGASVAPMISISISKSF